MVRAAQRLGECERRLRLRGAGQHRPAPRVDFEPAAPFDLVVCYDVLQYLDERAAARAMANLGRLSRVALYFSALTIEDWRENCDRSRTDSAVTMRPAAWYRARLRRDFYYFGLGVWIRKTWSTVRWALES